MLLWFTKHALLKVFRMLREPSPFHGSKQNTMHLLSTRPRIYTVMNQVI
jgi:hypothetical protein